MDAVFVKVLNMSIAASWLILAVLLLRLALKRAPKWTAVLLWSIVALRLALPFSLESAWSLIPSAETFSVQNIRYETPVIQSGLPAINRAVNPVFGEVFAPSPVTSVNPFYVWTLAASVLWLVGVAAMLLYAVISYARVRRCVAESVLYAGNIFLCDRVSSPFILGLLRPKIYLPSGMDDAAMEPVIAHERAHLARRDHWWKPLGFLILTAHWFNPLCWLAYALLCRDIEFACDERVIRRLDPEGKKRYSNALLSCSTGRRTVAVCPLAFGELGVKERIKSILNYKKPAFWLISLALLACAAVALCFLTDPAAEEQRVTPLPTAPLSEEPADAPKSLNLKDITVGTTVKFGAYEQDNNTANGKEEIEWLVLAVEDGRTLLISKYALDCKPYHNEYTDITWEKCTLRGWLNRSFYNEAFSSEQQKLIAASAVTADKNPLYDTNRGNDTTDKVFLLSIPEAKEHFSSDGARQCKPTAYAKAQGAYTSDTGLCWWWLRSPGDYSYYAASVLLGGGVNDCGDDVNHSSDAVRPALWIELE